MNLDIEIVGFDPKRRFGGLARLYGETGATRIQAAHVVVVGLGGVGSWTAEAAARSGVSHLTLIDFDHVAESNINRQIHATDATLGQPKVHAMRDRIGHINSACRVECIEEFVNSSNWSVLMSDYLHVDRSLFAVVDACDQVNAKTTMAAWAEQNKTYLITVGAAGGKRHAHKVDVDDLSVVTHDPLLAKMRYKLRKQHGASRVGNMNLTCVFSRESVTKPKTSHQTLIVEPFQKETIPTLPMLGRNDGTLNCQGYGSVVSVTSTFGMCAASWVFNKIAGAT